MKALKVLGIAFFGLVILGALFGGSEEAPTTAEGDKWEKPTADSMAVPNLRIPVDVQRVSLNFNSNRMTIEGRIPKSAVSTSGTVFVWAFFTNPGIIDGSWSGFPARGKVSGDGDTLTVSVTGEPFVWANSGIPREGYRAYVIAGPDSTALPIFSRWRDKSRATTAVLSK
jgi:hypothetical protein